MSKTRRKNGLFMTEFTRIGKYIKLFKQEHNNCEHSES